MSLVDVLPIIRPGAEWNLRGDSYEGLEWLDKNQPKPTKKEIEDAIAAQEYREKRSSEYPSIYDQLDAIWKGGEDMATMRERIMGVKAKHPKPGK